MDPILDTVLLNAPHTEDHGGPVERLRACDTMEAKIMKYHSLSRKLAMF